MATSKVSLSFRVFKGEQLVAQHTLNQGVIKIGKVPSAHLRIDDDSVSRMHAIIEVTGDEICIIDLGSTRGTVVNGQRINKAKLSTGDTITLGEMRIEVGIAAAVAAAAPAPAPAPAAVVVASPAVAPPMPAPVLATVPPPVPAPLVRAVTAPAPLAVPAPSPMLFQQAMADAADDLGGARAVEVAAMLGDSVVNVKHCIDPRSGKITSGTWGFLALGAACLLASATAFAVSVHTAATNKSRLDYWTRVEHKPEHAFRPIELSFGVDWMAFGGLALGLVGVTAGLARARRERQSPYFRIGTAPGVEQPVEQAPTPAFPLVAPSGDDFVFNYGHGIDGEMILDGRATPLAELVATGRARPSIATAGAIEVPIPPNARIRARAGQTTFVVSAVARPRRQAAPLFAMENRTLAYFAGSLAVHLGVWAFLNTIPPDDSSVSLNMIDGEATLGHIDNTEKETVPDKPDETQTGDGGGQENNAVAMKFEEGKAGDPKVNQDGKLTVKNNNAPPQLSKEQQLEMAANAGVLGSQLLSGGVKELAATTDFSSGFDVTDNQGQIYGADGVGNGNFGAGRKGWGPGGGCLVEPCGIIGTNGRYATIGGGTHAGDAFRFPGTGGPGQPGHHKTLPTVGEPVTSGPGYDRSIIRRYIRRHVNELGYCYEKQLLAHPGLGGEIQATFFITPNGTVQKSTAHGFDNEVASCVASVIGTIEFPKPGDGIGVQVNYPFNFHPTGR